MLEVGAAVAARFEAEALKLARYIGRHGVELRARRGTAEHRVVGDDPNATLHVSHRDGRRAAGGRLLPLGGSRSGEHREQQRQAVSHRFQGLEVGEAKPNAPDRGGLRSGALALLCRSRLAPLELGFGAWLLLWGLTLRLDPRLTTRWGSLASRLGARWRRVSASPLFRDSSALWLRRRPHGLLGPVGLVRPVAPLGTPGLVAVIGLVRPVALIALVRPVPMIGLVGPVPTIGLVVPTISAAIVVPLVLGA